MKPSPEREIQIGMRLRAFREAKRISRTAFAISIRIGSERLASYEAGRVPLRFEVFKAISQEYSINPMWLATGEGSPSQDKPFPLGDVEALVASSTPFSQAYDSYLDAMCRDRSRHARVLLDRYLDSLRNLAAFLKQNPKERIPPEAAKELCSGFENVKAELRELLSFGDALERRFQKLQTLAGGAKEKVNQVLTEVTPERKFTDMTEIALLLQRLKRALEGVKKGDLARSLNVPLPRVSEWLNGRVMPSGETALRLLHWVEQRESKQNTLGSTTNTTKGKTQIGKSSYEKPTQVRKKK